MKPSDTVTHGPERGPHRSLFKATGLRDADLRRPLVGIANSYTDVVPGHVHLDAVGAYLKDQVRAAGATPILFNTIAICDGIAMGHTGMKYSLASRELIADCVESMVRAHRFDALLCLPNCDKVVPGMFLAALRCNVPTVMVSGGPMEAGRVARKDVDLIDQFYAVAQEKVGALSARQVRQYENNTCPTCGSCSGMFTANSMNCLAEAIGLALPSNGTCLATSPVRRELFARAAQRVVAMAKEWIAGGCKRTYPLLPRRILTKKAFENAFTLDMAMGGSSNTVLHLLAMAHEAGVPFTLDDVQRISKRTANICRIAPSETPEGRIYHIQDCHRAGGISTILHQLAEDKPSLLHAEARTVTGETLGENLQKWSLRSRRRCAAARRSYAEGWKATGRSVEQVRAMYRGAEPADLPAHNADSDFDAADVIRPMERAFTDRGGLVALRGNIARDGAIVKQSGLPPSMLTFTGRAVICESQEDACRVILDGKVAAGDVVVIRNEGPKGGPGMQEMLAPTSYIRGMGLYEQCYLLTDGRFSGGTSGPAIGHIAPEAAAGGEIALLKTGDEIEIDIPAGTLNAKVSAAEFKRRRARWTPPKPPINYGALGRYADHATSADTGAVLDWPGKEQAP